MPLLWLLALLVTLTSAPSGAWGQSWRLPVSGGHVARPFHYDESHPFARGRRRGVDISGRPGAPVRAACGGLVSHAGRVPVAGLGVTVRCGRLSATHLGLGRLLVSKGDVVVPGAPIGTVGPRGLVRLGARVTDRRWGWVDPLHLTGRDGGPRPLLPRAARRRGRPLRAPAPVRPAGRRAPAPIRERSWESQPAGGAAGAAVCNALPGDPLVAMIGAAAVLLSAGVPLHRMAWRWWSRRRTGRPEVVEQTR